MREGIPAAFFRYEQKKQQIERVQIERAYTSSKKKWQAALQRLKKKIDQHIPDNQFDPDIPFAATAEQDYLESRVQFKTSEDLPDEAALVNALFANRDGER